MRSRDRFKTCYGFGELMLFGELYYLIKINLPALNLS